MQYCSFYISFFWMINNDANNGCKSLMVSSHFFFQSYHDKDSFFHLLKVWYFLKNCFTGGKGKKNELSSVCEKFEFFFVKGIFSSFFFIKFISKKLKQKEIERKGNISFFPFLRIFFFHFFIYKLLIL